MQVNPKASMPQFDIIMSVKAGKCPCCIICNVWSVESWWTKCSIPWNVPQSTGRYLPQQLTTCEGHSGIGLIAIRDKVQSNTVCWSGFVRCFIDPAAFIWGVSSARCYSLWLPLVWFNSMNHLIAYTCSMELWSTCCHDGYALRLWPCYNGHKLTPPFYSSQIIA